MATKDQPTFEEILVECILDGIGISDDIEADVIEANVKDIAKEISKLAEKTALEAVGEEIENERSLYSKKEFELLKKLTSPATAETIAVNYKVGINSARYQARQRIKELFGGGKGKNG